MEELAPTVRVNSLILGPVISRTRPTGDSSWITADDVGRVCVTLATDSQTTGHVIRLDTVDDQTDWQSDQIGARASSIEGTH